MKQIIKNVRFLKGNTMVFGDLYLDNGYVEKIDYKTPIPHSNLVIPGFVDMHTHGFRGISCDVCDIDSLRELACEYAKRGVTTFCPTISARPLKEYGRIIECYRKAFFGDYMGARFGGFHLEGPYLNPKMCGNIDPNKLEEIHLSELQSFLEKYHEDIQAMSISPELPHAKEAMRYLRLYGVEISLAHSNATYQQTKEAFDAGAARVTHLCNTMPEIDHHKEGMMDAIILSDCKCEIIMDGVHVNRKMLDWLIPLLGSERIIAISDGTKYSGFVYPQGYELEDGGIIHNQAVYKDGKLCGSCCDLLHIFQYLHQKYDLKDCIRMCSENASRLLRSYTWEIGVGKAVNLVVLDKDLQIVDVLINGRSAR